ncbi:MAG: hypothetical protein ACK5W9_01270 [Bdellovibrionales bacterium]
MQTIKLLTLIFTLLFSLSGFTKGDRNQTQVEQNNPQRIVQIKDEISSLENRLILYRVEQGAEIVGIALSAAVTAYLGNMVFKGLTNPHGMIDAKPIMAATGVATLAGAGVTAGLGYRVYYIQTNQIPLLRANISSLKAQLEEAIRLNQILQE